MLEKEKKRSVVTYPELIFIVFVFAIILVALYPKDMLKKQILSEKANYDLSMLYLKNLLKQNPEDESLMLILAKQSLRSGNIDLALRLSELLHKSQDPKIRKKALLLGYDLAKERYFYIKDPKKQKEELKRLRKIFIPIFYQGMYKEDVQKWYKEAQFLSLPREQLLILKDLIKERPESIKLLKEGYYLAQNLKDHDASDFFLQQLLEKDKLHHDQWVLQNYYLAMQKKDYKSAEDILVKLASKEPKYNKELADFYLYTKQYTKASNLFLRLHEEAKEQRDKNAYFRKAVNALIAGKKLRQASALLHKYENKFLTNTAMQRFILKQYLAANDLNAANNFAKKILRRKYGL